MPLPPQQPPTYGDHSPKVEDGAATKIQAQVRRRRDSLTAQFTQASNTLNHIESINESAQLNSNISIARTVALLDSEMQNAIDGEDVSPRVRQRAGSISGSQTNQNRKSFVFSPTPRVTGPVDASFCLPAPTLAANSMTSTHSPRRVDSTAPGGGVPNLDFLCVDKPPRVSKECITAVLGHFKQADATPLDFDDMRELLYHMIDLLRKEVDTALVEVRTPPAPGKLVLLGDTHGQLNDVLWIFFKYGEPSESNVFLFNGDVADRGTSAIEILTLIMLYKLWAPGCMHLNRGNHEDRTMNQAYGFLDECLTKYGQTEGAELYDLFNVMFEHLPLFSVIDSSVFVVHGGLWRRPPYGLQLLQRLDFRRPIPDPTSGIGPDLLIFDSMWSDPQTTKGFSNNARGSNIVQWGPDITEKFLKVNHLRLLVRSHQLPPGGRGFAYTHAGTCLTVFSASNYCGQCGNLGSVMLMVRGEEDRVEEHWAPSLDEMRLLETDANRAMARIKGQARELALQRQSLRYACQQMEKEVLKRVQELIVSHKAGLFEHWSLVDTSPPGVFCISPATWREGCVNVVDDALPWKHFERAMGVVNSSGEVHYVKFLTRYRIAFESSHGMSIAGWERGVWSKILETLLYADLSLREALAALDPTNNGLVSPGEFGKLLESCGVEISAMQARSLLRTFVTSGGSKAVGKKPKGIWEVSLWDVLTRLQVSLPISTPHDSTDPGLADWAVPKLRDVASVVSQDAWSRLADPQDHREDWPAARLLAVWFEEADRTQNGFLEHDEFIAALSTLQPALAKKGVPTDHKSLARLVKYVDTDGNGRVNFFELLNGFTWEDALGKEFEQDVLETINSAIYFNIAPIRSALLRFDPDQTGEVTSRDFIIALAAVQSALNAGISRTNCLTRLQISAIAHSIVRNDDDRINYEKFLGSFRIVDTWDPGSV